MKQWWRRVCRFWNKPKHAGYLFIAPSCLTLTVFLAFPLFFSFFISLTDLPLLLNKMNFVGFDNFVRAFEDQYVWGSFKNTLWFFITETPLQVIVGLIMAACLTKTDLFTRFMRSVYFIPVICSGASVGIIWSLILDNNIGMIPYLMQKIFSLEDKPMMLRDPTWAMFLVSLMTVWKSFGQTMIILVAGLQGISRSYYEAAEIDGANKVQQFFKITVPLVIPTLSFCIITNTIGSIQVFDQVYVATRGGPNFATRSAVMYIYQAAFEKQKLGYASAIAVLLFFIIIIISGSSKIYLNHKEKKML